MKVPATAACITAALLCLPQARAQGRTQQYAQCSGYYYTLSFATPEFVMDLTEQQAKQAAFAMLMKVNPDITSPEAIGVLGENWNALQAPLPRPLTQQSIDALRAGHDGSCRALSGRPGAMPTVTMAVRPAMTDPLHARRWPSP
ncbi:MAG: hypothetical protein ACN6RG_08910 [Stenotrophomonas sp.]